VLSSKLFKIRSQTLKQRSSGLDLARLESVSGPHSGDFLHVVPSPALGFLMGSAEYSAGLCMRLGLPTNKIDGRLCPACCHVQISLRGEHCLTCSSDRDRIGRHNTMRDLIHASMRDALLNPIKEPLHLVSGSQQHPDMYVPAWTMTPSPMAFDITVPSPFHRRYAHPMLLPRLLITLPGWNQWLP
jgi:hypothetical protein